jgi:hypothetical protein
MGKRKWIIIGAVVLLLVAAYAVYAIFFLKRVPIGGICEASAMCEGECLGFGDLLPDYGHAEICTKGCSAATDCPAPTTCQQVEVISTDGTGVGRANKTYCLPTKALGAP